MNNPVGIFNGTNVYISDVFTKEVPVKKHKKYRVTKKWFKRYGTKTVKDENISFLVEGIGLIVTTKTYNILKKHLIHK